jgi:hypothetical protein
MDTNERYRRARSWVRSLRGLYTHAVVFALVNGGLLLQNLFTSPQHFWFQWPLFGWGIALAGHALAIFAGRPGNQWEERQIQKVLAQSEGQHPDESSARPWPDTTP